MKTYDIRCPSCGGGILDMNTFKFGDGYAAEIRCQSNPLCRVSVCSFVSTSTVDAIKKAVEMWTGRTNDETPEEIKKGLECCTSKKMMCAECPYFDGVGGCKGIEKDSLSYITQLESRLAQAERERDAAVRDLWGDCCYCAHNSLTDPRCIERCKRCKHAPDAEERGEIGVDRWEWRGVCEENSR